MCGWIDDCFVGEGLEKWLYQQYCEDCVVDFDVGGLFVGIGWYDFEIECLVECFCVWQVGYWQVDENYFVYDGYFGEVGFRCGCG